MQMSDNDISEDIFTIKLTIDGTDYKDVLVRVSDPYKTIREQILSIVKVFELPLVDKGLNPIQYHIGRKYEDDIDELFDFEDINGCELTLLDYGICPGDALMLQSLPIGVSIGGGPTISIKLFNKSDAVLYNLRSYWNKSIGELISGMVDEFHLPKYEKGYKIIYELASLNERTIYDNDALVGHTIFPTYYPYTYKYSLRKNLSNQRKWWRYFF